MRAGTLLQALHLSLPFHHCASPAAQQACFLLATFFNASLDPRLPEAGEERDCHPCSAALDLQGGGELGALWEGA